MNKPVPVGGGCPRFVFHDFKEQMYIQDQKTNFPRELRVFTPENDSRLHASPLTSRLVKLGDYARLVAIP